MDTFFYSVYQAYCAWQTTALLSANTLPLHFSNSKFAETFAVKKQKKQKQKQTLFIPCQQVE